MEEKEKFLTEEEREIYRKLEGEFRIYKEMGKLRDGKQVRDYIKAHKKEIKEYGVYVPIQCMYPYLTVTVSAIAVGVSLLYVLFVLR